MSTIGRRTQLTSAAARGSSALCLHSARANIGTGIDSSTSIKLSRLPKQRRKEGEERRKIKIPQVKPDRVNVT